MDDCLFRIKPSTITKAGKGLFTLVNIEKGEIVLEYKGMVQPYSSHRNHEYCLEIKSGFCLNAKKNTEKARYVNDTYGHQEKTINLEWLLEGGRAYMISTMFISRNSELFISYGNRYWQ